MTNGNLGYTSRTNVENFLGQTFPAIGTSEFNAYLAAAERYIENYCGYNVPTTSSGILAENITREKSLGKIDNDGNLVIDIKKPPLHFDANQNPIISLLEFNLGAVRVTLNLTDGTSNALNTVLETSESARKIYYPSIYFLPAISTVTPTAKINLFNLRDVKFWTDISYTGGYTVIPEDITQAANYLTAEFILHRNNPEFLVAFRQGSMSEDYVKKSENSKGLKVSEGVHVAQALLQNYVLTMW